MGVFHPQFVDTFEDGTDMSSNDCPEDLLQLSYAFYACCWNDKTQMEEVYQEIRDWKE